MRTFLFLITLLFCVFSYSQSTEKEQVIQYLQKDYNYLENLYKHFHQNPELSFLEEKTAARLAKELKEIGFEVTEKVGGHGIVGVLKNGEGPTILVRADMDALPILEETGLDYASEVKMTDITGDKVSVMHACGHDMHITVWTGAARALAKMKDQWKGTVVFIGQPAEERGSGARNMLKEGLFEKFPVPDYGVALHVHAGMPAGTIGYCPEFSMANVDMMNIKVFGEGGHGAYPHTTIDPVVLAAKIIVDIQTIVSREVSPLDPAVVTVGSIHGGTKGNVIPNEVEMKLTLRSYTDEVRQTLIDKIKLKCKAAAMAAGLSEDKYPEVKLRDEFTPALYNDPKLTDRIADVFVENFGKKNIHRQAPVMGGEDFGRYGKTEDNVPIFMYRLGVVNPKRFEEYQAEGKQLPSLHSSKFAPDIEPSIKTGVRSMVLAVLELLD
ncbi:MAG: amidohydrolase [Chitinophagales bacterium]